MLASIISLAVIALFMGFVLWLAAKCDPLKSFRIAASKDLVPKSTNLGTAQIEERMYGSTLWVAATPEDVYFICKGPFFGYPKKVYRIRRKAFFQLEEEGWDYGIRTKGGLIRCRLDRAIWEVIPELALW